MKRHIAGLQGEARHEGDLLEGVFLVRVDGARYCWHPQKPFFSIHFSILEPKELTSRAVAGRLYCTPKALWRLNWFLRDFGYDPDLFGREEVDEKGPPRTPRSSPNRAQDGRPPVLPEPG